MPLGANSSDTLRPSNMNSLASVQQYQRCFGGESAVSMHCVSVQTSIRVLGPSAFNDETWKRGHIVPSGFRRIPDIHGRDVIWRPPYIPVHYT